MQVMSLDFLLTDGWVATEVRRREGSRLALVLAHHGEEQQSARFDLDKAAFIDVAPFRHVDRDRATELDEQGRGNVRMEQRPVR